MDATQLIARMCSTLVMLYPDIEDEALSRVTADEIQDAREYLIESGYEG